MFGRCSPGGEHGIGKNGEGKFFKITDRIIGNEVQPYKNIS